MSASTMARWSGSRFGFSARSPAEPVSGFTREG
jgi:hypothetical protein